MKVYVTDDNFYQTWFVFRCNPERDRLLELYEEIHCIYPYEEDGETYPALLHEDIGRLCYSYSWTEAPYIVFSTNGIINDIPYVFNNYSSLRSDGEKSFFNAKIHLSDLDEISVRVNDMDIDDVVVLAKARWCQDMGLSYIREDYARDLQLKLNNTENLLKEESKKSDYMTLIDKYRKMPYAEYLKTEHWKHFRSEAIKFSGGKCAMCPQKDLPSYQMNLHHRTYENLGRETFNDVIVLCDTCHQKHHNVPLKPS